MTIYRPRGLEARLRQSAAGAKVLVIEGTRAVGKTSLVTHMVHDRDFASYADLTDQTVRSAADADLEGWLRSLPTPAVIDEAQVLPGLPLAVKRLVDERDERLQFILTGSASIARTGLDGADPLTGRAERLTLHPFTEAERRGLSRGAPNLVEALFEGVVPEGAAQSEVDEALLLERMEIGGMPAFALGEASERSRRFARIREDVLDALSRELAPNERFDSLKVRDTLDALIRAPGRIVNDVRLGNALGLDRRTVDRYLTILERRFLLVRLPNLAMSPAAQAWSRAKAHPFDTALAAESLRRAGIDLRADRERFGQLLESWVVQQVTSSASWSPTDVSCSYWRRTQRPQSEVDLVLTDGQGRNVGIEVKAAHSVGTDDIRGLQAIASIRGLHRGFVIYLGRSIVRLADRIWALPVSYLDNPGEFVIPKPDQPTPLPAVAQALERPDATLFLSYAHADDEYLNGAIVRFAEALARSYRFLFGRSIEIFVDRTGIAWGVAWQQRLDDAVTDTQFLLAMVTPTYLTSEACRREFEQFLTASGPARDELVLALTWTPLPENRGGDPVRDHVDAHQFLDGRTLAELQPESTAWRTAVEDIARRLHTVTQAREQTPAKLAPVAITDVSDGRDLMELFGDFERERDPLEQAVARMLAAMDAIGTAFAAEQIPAAADSYATNAVFARIGAQLVEPVADLEAAAKDLGAIWSRMDVAVTAAIPTIADVAGTAAVRSELRQSMVELRTELDLPGMAEFEAIAGQLGAISRHLRPAGRALHEILRVLRTMQQTADHWRRQLE